MTDTAATAPVIKFKKKKVLTRPVLKFIEGTPNYVKLVGPMHLGKDIKEKKGSDEKKKDPATLIDCINLMTGEEAQIIASAVIKSVLEDNYPEHSYVGLCFEMTKQARQPGKAYNPVHIEEIEEPVKEEPAPAPAASTSEESTQTAGVEETTRTVGNRRR